MRLHLGAEDIALQLEDLATTASQRIPLAHGELTRLREDSERVRSTIESTLEVLNEPESDYSTMSRLIELDMVKSRMEEACTTLKEAAGLSSLFTLVEDLFMTKDFGRIAEALSGIRKGLNVVAECVPEFKDGRTRLARLEDRLAEAVTAPLSLAFSNARAQEVASLADILVDIGRKDKVVKAYKEARLPSFQSAWEGYAVGTPFVPWLATFYDQMLHNIAAEYSWCKQYLPVIFPDLVLDLFQNFFSLVDKPTRARLAGALSGSSGSVQPLESLEQACLATSDFVRGLKAELEEAGALDQIKADSSTSIASTGNEHHKADKLLYGLEILKPLLMEALAPLEGALAQYPDFEYRYIDAELSKVLHTIREALSKRQESDGTSRSTAIFAQDSVPATFSEAVEASLSIVSGSVDRCRRITDCTSIVQVSKLIDRALQSYTNSSLSLLVTKRLRPSEGQGAEGEISYQFKLTFSIEEAASLFMSIIRLHKGIEAMELFIKESSREALEPILALVTAVTDELKPSHSKAELVGGMACENLWMSLSTIRMTLKSMTSNGAALAQELQEFLLRASPRLSNSLASAGDLVKAGYDMMESALLKPIEEHIEIIPTLSEWKTKPSSEAHLPEFHMYPQQYVTSIGEHLMMMPQLLASVLASMDVDRKTSNELAYITKSGSMHADSSSPLDVNLDGNPAVASADDLDKAEDDDEMVGYWVDRAALSAARKFESKLWEIPVLTSTGSNQLAADIEYFANVMATLGIAVPDSLVAWQAATSASDRASLKSIFDTEQFVSDASFVAIVKKVEKLRGFTLE